MAEPMTLAAAINRAATKLPAGWSIEIAVVRKCCSVLLFDPCSNCKNFQTFGNTAVLDQEYMADDIEAALQAAIENDKGHGKLNLDEL